MQDLDIEILGRRAPQPSALWAVWVIDARRATSGFASLRGKIPKWETPDEAEATATFWNAAVPTWASQYYEARQFTTNRTAAKWGVWALNLITGEGEYARMDGVTVTVSEADAHAKAALWNIRPPKDTAYQAKELRGLDPTYLEAYTAALGQGQ
jgi:hypothetical protein